MDRYPERFVVLLIDFDGHRERLNDARAVVPARFTVRVFVLGAWTGPEDLRRDLGTYETIGKRLAADCREDTNTVWGHALPQHNASEIQRLREIVKPVLFDLP
jgi:hypothetical protein